MPLFLLHSKIHGFFLKNYFYKNIGVVLHMGYFVDLFLFFIVFSLEWKFEQVEIREQLYI